MLTSFPESQPQKGMRTFSATAILFALVILSASPVAAPARGENPSDAQKNPLLGHHLVIVVDTNPNQQKVLPVELSVAERVVEELKQPENTFSVITFGCLPPMLLKSNVGVDEAVSALQHVEVEQKATDNISTDLREGLNLAFDQFTDTSGSRSVLIISEGQDYFPGKTFKQTLLRARQLQVVLHVAMVADHTFYGAKAIQHYGFNLRILAAKTHGRYVEVGSRQKRVPTAVDRLSKRILSQSPVK